MALKHKNESEGLFKGIMLAYMILILHVLLVVMLGFLVLFLRVVVQYMPLIFLGGIVLISLSSSILFAFAGDHGLTRE